MINIEQMNTDQFINYREQLLDEYFNAGYVLTPNINCSTCDRDNDYTCFQCEIDQINEKEIPL
jgi:hypothetical protein